jgi:hypothetical protein
MKTHKPAYLKPVDVHAALARAQADRAEYVRTAFAQIPALVKRLAARLRGHRLPRNGAWA